MPLFTCVKFARYIPCVRPNYRQSWTPLLFYSSFIRAIILPQSSISTINTKKSMKEKSHRFQVFKQNKGKRDTRMQGTVTYQHLVLLRVRSVWHGRSHAAADNSGGLRRMSSKSRARWLLVQEPEVCSLLSCCCCPMAVRHGAENIE